MQLLYDPEILLPGIYPRCKNIYTLTCARIFLVALIMAKKWKSSKCSTVDKLIKCVISIQRNIINLTRNEVWIYATTWISLESMLNEKEASGKGPHIM